MGCRHDLVINGIPSAIFVSGSDVLSCDWRKIFFKNAGGFFCSHDSSLLQNKVYLPRQKTKLSVFDL